MTRRLTYRDYILADDAHPWYKWSFAHDGFDGAPDSGDVRFGYGRTVEDCLDEIDLIIEEENDD